MRGAISMFLGADNIVRWRKLDRKTSPVRSVATEPG